VHPLVADALARRAAPGAASAPPAVDPATEPGEGGIGWPAPAKPGGGGLGWPGDLDSARAGAADREAPAQDPAAQESVDQESAVPDSAVPDSAVPAEGRRNVWRRLFGARTAA
jgi:hypothetical protein